MELPLAIVILGIIRPEDSGAAFEQTKTSLIWVCIGGGGGGNPLDMPRSPYWASERKHT